MSDRKQSTTLTAAEKDQLRDAIQSLLSLDWTPAKLARYLGYCGGYPIYRVMNGHGGVRRCNYEKIMALVENCTLASEVELRDDAKHQEHAEKRAYAERARELWDRLRAHGVSLDQAAQAAGYKRPRAFSAALDRGSLTEARYRTLRAFSETVLRSAHENGRADHEETERKDTPGAERMQAGRGPRGASTPQRNGRPESNGAKAVNGRGATTHRNGTGPARAGLTGVPIFDYLQTARDELEQAAATLQRAREEAANALTGPGIERFRTQIRKIQSQIDEALVMR